MIGTVFDNSYTVYVSQIRTQEFRVRISAWTFAISKDKEGHGGARDRSQLSLKTSVITIYIILRIYTASGIADKISAPYPVMYL